MDNPGMGGEMGHDESMHDEGMEKKDGYPSLYLSPNMLPEGMKANPGDILEFKVVGTDKDGDTEIVYNTGKDGKEDDGMSEWENDFRQEMSARKPEEGEEA